MTLKMMIVGACVVAASAAFAQTPPAAPAPGNNAVNTPSTPTPAAPVAGANSFTEAQAKSRLEANGFTAVSGLTKDDQGVWRGKATRSGSTVDVSVDFQGNIVTR